MTPLPALSIGSVSIGSPFVQAALSGYSDWPMRLIARRLGASYAVCEVMLDQFLVTVKSNRLRNEHFLHITDEERPVGGQLMGAEPEQFAAGAVKLVEAGFDVIDINFGCPVKKVDRKSTRLNSSHSQISYAVFCLKKKKKKKLKVELTHIKENTT